MLSQAQKGAAFRALHARAQIFVLPNPWDIGSARLLAGLGFPALATTSAGFARAMGVPDYRVEREEVIAHVRALAASVDVPLSADLENGFGDSPQDVVETLRLGAEAGLVGASIEDSTGRPERPQYELAHAAERIRAAVECTRNLPFPFTLTARAENFFTGAPDLRDTIARLQAYQEAGADVLYAPCLRTVEDIRSVLASIDRPLNVLIGPTEKPLTVQELEALGVRRVSLGSALASAASGALLRAARELLEGGTFGFLEHAARGKELDALLAKGAAL